MHLHFSIGGYDCRRTARFRQGIHFSIPTSTLLRGCLALATLSPLETDPQILERPWLLSRFTTGCPVLSCSSCFFNMATALLSSFFLDLCVDCSSTWRCAKEHFSQTDNHSWSCGTSILEGAIFHKMSYCKFFWGNPWKPSRRSTTGAPASGTSGSRWFSLTLLHERILRRIWWWTFPTLIHIVAETAIVSFHTLPVGFPLPTNSKNSLYTLFCSLILDHGVLLIIPFLAPKFLFRESCSTPLFTIVFNLW